MSARVLVFVVNTPEFFMSHRAPVARAARRNGWRVHVVTPPGPAVEQIVADGFEYHSIPLGRRSVSLVGELGSVRALHRLFREIRPDVVHNVALKAVLYGTIAARLAGVPRIVNAVTGLGYLFSQQGAKGALLRLSALAMLGPVLRARRTSVIFQNPDDLAEFTRARVIAPEQAVLIRGSGVDLRQFTVSDEPPGVPIVLFASRMLWDKGVGDFVEAARMLQGRVRARFVLAGGTDDNPAAVPAAQLEAWQRSGVVEWWGKRDDMPEVLRACTVVVFPSTYREGVPKVLIEAAASGRPIVTTDTPGCREVVRDGENGVLVPPHDVTAIAVAVERLLSERDRRLAFGRTSRGIAEREFGLESVIKATLDLYEPGPSPASVAAA